MKENRSYEQIVTERRETIPTDYRCDKCDGYGGGNTIDHDTCKVVGKWMCDKCKGSGIS